jgi:uroporphyrinogen III methyltransferase/synthase
LDKDSKPLEGKRVVLTRAPDQAAELARLLERVGAEVLSMPTVAFAPPENLSAMDAAIDQLDQFDWILLTSMNVVRFFIGRMHFRDAINPLRSTKVGAVGPGTAILSQSEGMDVDYVAKKGTGESLAKELAERIRGCRILLPRSDRADDRLPALLREVGADVTEVIAYRTIKPETLDVEMVGQLRRAEVAAIVFASPSAFHNLCDTIPAEELAKLSERVQFVAIGPTTAKALESAGVRVAIQAKEASAEALAQAIAKHFDAAGGEGPETRMARRA